MKTLPSEFITELEKEVNFLKHLIYLNFSQVLRLTDADMDILYGGSWYSSYGIEFDAAHMSSSVIVDSIAFSVVNVDRAFSTIVLSEETRGKECQIYRVALDKNMKVLGITNIFTGYLDAVDIDNRRTRFEVYNHFIKWRMMTPRRYHQATCHWTFKGTRCGYSAGETWCDHSWARCYALFNTVNFGGFRWIPSIQTERIVWGR